MDLLKEAIGSEGEVSLKVVGGKMVLELSHGHSSGKVSVVVEEDLGYFFDKLSAAIPGTFDDALLAMIKQAVKAL